MRYSVIVFAVLLIVAVAFGLYRMEYQIREMENRLADVNRQVLESSQAVQVLQAEWSYLNQPRRLKQLTDLHLEMVPLLPSQIGLLQDLPMQDELHRIGGVLDYAPQFADAWLNAQLTDVQPKNKNLLLIKQRGSSR